MGDFDDVFEFDEVFEDDEFEVLLVDMVENIEWG